MLPRFFDYTNRETIRVVPLCEAAAAWRLWNHHASQAPAGKRILRLNLDETRVNYFLKAGLGNISMNKHSRPWQRVSKHHLRAGITHVGFICDDTSLQPLLPQVLIVNGATVLKRDMAAILASLPDNVFVLRRKSSWNNAQIMCMIIDVLGRLLHAEAGECFPILLLDAARIHVHSSVLHACDRWAIRIAMVPPGLTWLLQPLDTHAFAAFKRMLTDCYQERFGEAGGHVLPTVEWLLVVSACVQRCLVYPPWGGAFDSNGYGSNQELVSARVRKGLVMEEGAAFSATIPSVVELRLLLPKGCDVDWFLMTQCSVVPYSYEAGIVAPVPPRRRMNIWRGARRVALPPA